MASIYEKVKAGERLGTDEGLFLLNQASLDDLAHISSEIAEKRHGAQVTFVLDTNPNYTNICENECLYCAFYRHRYQEDAYVLSAEEIAGKVKGAVNKGATTILMQGGCNPDLDFDYYLGLVRELKNAYPHTHLHLFSPPEIIAISRKNGKSTKETLQILKGMGLSTLPGGGAEILSDSIRTRISPKKCKADEWLRVMHEAHELGFRTTATMVFGFGEDNTDIIKHLEAIRNLQDKTGGFTAFVPWSFKEGKTGLKKSGIHQSGTKYLRILATARIFLDNFPHIQASWFSEGKRTGQLGLLFGADDFGGILFEENVLKAAEFNPRIHLPELLDLIRGTGKTPARRDTLYNILEVLDE